MKIPTNDTKLEGEFVGQSNRNKKDDFEQLLTDDDSFSYDDDFEYQEETKYNCLISPLISAYVWLRYFSIYRRAECILAIFLAISVTLALTGVVLEYEGYETGIGYRRPILHDYSEIHSAMELKLGDVDHWCVHGGDDSCPMCEDPLEASFPQEKGSLVAFRKNIISTRKAMKEQRELDVIFLGDSIIEALTGNERGVEKQSLKNIKEIFDSQFAKAKGGKYDGLALGVTGDTSPNLLWRITQKEVPIDLNPKIWWINIGMNDLLYTLCSEQVTLMGILRVVEELYATRPKATIVINSLLPRATTRHGTTLKGNFIRNKNYESIEQVNIRLKKFASKHQKRVLFFDADDIFIKKSRGKVFMKRELFVDEFPQIHPNAEGHKIWGQAKMQMISKILASSAIEANTTHESSEDYLDNFDDDMNRGSLFDMYDDDDFFN